MVFRRIAWSLLATGLTLGCSAKTTSVPAPRYPSELELAECLAVLPFENQSDNERAGEIVAEVVANEFLASGKFRVMFRGETESRIRQQNISTPKKISPTFAAVLGEIIGVDAVLQGVVQRFAVQRFGPERKPEPQVRFELQLISARSGHVVWQGTSESLGTQRPVTYRLSAVALAQELARRVAGALAAALPGRTVDFSKPCGQSGDNLDLDGDGILNIVDRCPLEGGTVAHEGCPERSRYTGLARLSGYRIVLPAPLQFKEASAELDPASQPYLYSVAEMLRQSTYLVKVLIEGYAALQELPDQPRRREELAFARASSVKSFLTAQGVAAERLVAVGYGEVDRQNPAKSGVEFQVIEVNIAAAR